MPYIVDHSGSTNVDGVKVKYKAGEPVKDVKKGDLDHVKGAEWVSKKDLAKEEEDEDSKKK